MVQMLWETVQRLLKKLKVALPYDLAISPLGIHQGLKEVSEHPSSNGSIHKSQEVEATPISTGR